MSALRQPLVQLLAELGRFRLQVEVRRQSDELDALTDALEHKNLSLQQAHLRASDLVAGNMRLTEELADTKRTGVDALIAMQTQKEDSDRKLSAAAADAFRVDQVRREAREKLVELHTALQEANASASHGKGPAEATVLEHLEQLNTTIQFLGEGGL